MLAREPARPYRAAAVTMLARLGGRTVAVARTFIRAADLTGRGVSEAGGSASAGEGESCRSEVYSDTWARKS